jgi:prepilin-type processing-associated H-X9-DG protein
LLFETKAGFNQVGGPELLTTDNHNGKGCNVLFADNTVEFVKTEELANLKWKDE